MFYKGILTEVDYVRTSSTFQKYVPFENSKFHHDEGFFLSVHVSQRVCMHVHVNVCTHTHMHTPLTATQYM